MRFSFAPAALVAATAALSACQQSDPTLDYKLDQLSQKMENIQRRLDAMGTGGARPAAAQPPRPQPPQQDPNAVYSVAVGDAPVKGPANAKVTIVEAADFA